MNYLKNKGGVTIPTDNGFVNQTLEIANKWGADAVRDCDGTVMPNEITTEGYKVYSTYFVIRGDNNWAKSNLDELQHIYLLSNRNLCKSSTLEIVLLDGYFNQQFNIDFLSNPKKYWEVYDRTSNTKINDCDWEINQNNGSVIISNTIKMHEYTVSFLAFSIWDPVQMYNYITNNWDIEKQMMYDPKYPKTGEYIVEHMKKWLSENKKTNVIRFTTFLYQFDLMFNDKKKEKFVNWFGYTMSVSPKMIDDFESEYGYRLYAEDIVDQGYYNNPFRVPSKKFLDYMDFVQRQVTNIAKKLVDLVHSDNREAMMFLGDCWIGAEPYGKYFKDIGLDAVVGSVGGGVTVRMLTDIPDISYVEGRFLPYFFPDTFYEGNDPTQELNKNWLTARRAMMRKPLDRIGYGGYLKLAAKFPKFVDRVEEICSEFRTLYNNISGQKPFQKIKVAILNCWGKIRSWQSHMVAHELWYKHIYSYQGILEILSGLPVDVEFISFDDIKAGGIPQGLDVIINIGDSGTAFSGGDNWLDVQLVSTIKDWVYNGGGFIGVGEPTAVNFGGRFFQLADVLGVDKEIGLSLHEDKYFTNVCGKHFILEDVITAIDYGEGMKNIYAHSGANVLDVADKNAKPNRVNIADVLMATNDFGKGRGVYIAGLPFSFQNARILYRALYYAASKEQELKKCYVSNIMVECHYYPEKDLYALVNNSNQEQSADFYNIYMNKKSVTLKPMEILWL